MNPAFSFLNVWSLEITLIAPWLVRAGKHPLSHNKTVIGKKSKLVSPKMSSGKSRRIVNCRRVLDKKEHFVTVALKKVISDLGV